MESVSTEPHHGGSIYPTVMPGVERGNMDL